jgi:Ca-activated chloride channel family protein
VIVTDRGGRPVPALKGEDFRLYEDRVEQKISFFSAEEAPVSWGLILDRSGSMMEMIGGVYRAAVHVIDEGTDQDEMFAATFNEWVELASDFTTDRHKLENSLLGLRADGMTALWDAVAFGLERIRHGQHRKKVLVVITDGEDNRSRLSFRDLVSRVEEADVLIYTVGMFESIASWPRDPLQKSIGSSGPQVELEKLAEATGARAHFPANVEECKEAMQEIAREVSQQYSLGYYPTRTVGDGKWRKIQVKVGQRDGKTTYVARTRAGYYAPKTGA